MVNGRAAAALLAVLAVAGCVGVVAAASAATNDYLGVAPPKVEGTPAQAVTCAACHGKKGVATAPTFPNLAGQNYNYLLKQLEDFRDGHRKAATMSAIIKTVPTAADNRNLKQLAAYFSEFPLNRAGAAAASEGKLTKAEAKAGYQLYFEGDPAAPIPIPACAACHIATGLGDAPMAVPRLAGQNAAYVVAQLKAFASGQRHNGPDHIMDKIASRLTDKDIQAVAGYVAHMQPGLLPGSGPKTLEAFMKAGANQPVPGIPASAVSVSSKP